MTLPLEASAFGTKEGLRVVVLVYGLGGCRPRILDQLLRAEISPASILVVQNPAKDDEPDIVLPDPQCRLMRMPTNVGYAAAMNAGVRQHLRERASFLLLVTQDVRLGQGAIRRLVRAAQLAPQFGILGPAMWCRGAGLPFSFGGIRKSSAEVDHIRARRPLVDGLGLSECDWVEGAAMLIRAEVFRDIGLFDERFFMYFEETDFCLRATRSGWRAGILLEAEAEQEPGSQRRPGAYAYLLARNGLEYARRAAGLRGIAALMCRQCRESHHLLRVLGNPRSNRKARAAAYTALCGMWRGTWAFLCRRWGPPPPTLRGLGDVRATNLRPQPRAALVSTFPPRRDGIARYAEQLAGGLRCEQEVTCIGLPGSRADRVIRLDGGLRPLRLLTATRRRDKVLLMWHPEFYITGRAWSRAAAYVCLGLVMRARGGKVVVHEPDRVRAPGRGTLRRIARRLEREAQRWFWASGAEIVFHSDREREDFVGLHGTSMSLRTAVVEHGKSFRPYAQAGRDEARRLLGLEGWSGPLFLCIGFVGPHKGFDRAVRAFTALPDGAARLYLVGSALYDTDEIAGYVAALHELVKEVRDAYLVERFVEDTEFDLWVQAADAVLAPYWSATSSSVVARARLLGTRVVATPVGALPEQLGQGDVLVDSDEELASALARLVGLTRVGTDG